MLFSLSLLVCIVVALGAGVLSAWSDMKTMIIPNKYPLAVLGSFFVAYGAAYLSGPQAQTMFQPFLSHLLAGGGLFILAFLLSLAVRFGGGDAKLLSAYGFWVGLSGVVDLIFYMSLCGGVLALVALGVKYLKPFKNAPEQSWVAQLQRGQSKIAYGIAIVFSAFINIFQMVIVFFS